MSGFKIKGFIEGFYGRVWADDSRLRVLKLCSEKGMNTYFYAPKDDPYLRAKWRNKYDELSFNKLKSLIEFTEKTGMDFYYCLSPGLDITYSSSADRQIILDKFNLFYNSGVNKFGIFLDDIPDSLSENDKYHYNDFCEAHTDIVNFLSDNLPTDSSLVVCPTVYHGTGAEEYIVKLCKNIREKVMVFWTGTKICSPFLLSEDAQKFYKLTGKKPLYWDNYPVNDAEMYGELHIGPYINRSPDLNVYSEGIVLNPMEYPLSSCISLLTACDYMNNPDGYEPEKSFREAVKSVTRDNYEDWFCFLDHTRYSCLNDCFSEYLSEELNKVRKAYFDGNTNLAVDTINSVIQNYEHCSKTMHNNAMMHSEIYKWVYRFDEITDILKSIKSFISDKSEISRVTLKDKMIKYNQNAYKLAGFSLREVTENLIGEFTI